MKPIISRILFFLFFISISCMSLYAQENQSYFLHTIEKGQSLYSISSMYGVSQADIIRLNPGCDEKYTQVKRSKFLKRKLPNKAKYSIQSKLERLYTN